MKPRLWAVLILSTALTAAAVGALAQQQQTRSPSAAGVGQKPQASAAGASLLDRLSSLLNRKAAAPQAPPADPNTPQTLPVNWSVAGRYAQASKGGRAAPFITRNRAAIDSLSVPVLLPGDPELLANMRIFPHGDFYTVSSNGPNGLSFIMSGHSRAYPLPPRLARSLKGGLAARIPPDGIVIEGTDVGLDAGFSRFGAAYTISLECRRKLADPRCGNDAYVRGVISRMVVVNPAGRG